MFLCYLQRILIEIDYMSKPEANGNKQGNTTMTKATIATLKSFIKKNQGKLYIKKKSSFDGMTDCAHRDCIAVYLRLVRFPGRSCKESCELGVVRALKDLGTFRKCKIGVRRYRHMHIQHACM